MTTLTTSATRRTTAFVVPGGPQCHAQTSVATFSIILGTSGRPSIHRTLKSIVPQLEPGDEVLIVRDDSGDAGEADGERFRRLLREHLAVYARHPRRARFFDKTHTNTLKIPLLATYLEGCEPFFVLVVRNPYSWCHRAVRRKRPTYRVEPTREDELGLVAQHWANSYRIALDDARSTPNVTLVRFEDFVAEPEATVRRLSEFVGLDFEGAMVPRPGDTFPFATLPGDRKWYPLFPDPWLAEVTPEEAAIVASLCEPLASELGYQRPPVARPAPEDVPVRS